MLARLKKRREFLRVARGEKWVTPGFIVQMRARETTDGAAADQELIRVGFTASKKVGNAVLRNSAKRRLRALAEEVLLAQGKPGHDYVLIARQGGATGLDFEKLRKDLRWALRKLHQRAGVE